ncbi:MAG: diacylglycerol kinase family lipid kinase [Acidobacteriota bacterium]|nr:diacylglycerol kinase family lipid kinase [Acidobacteriota bacterium]
MTPLRATIIINPIAGSGRAATLGGCSDLARSVLARHGYEADIRVTAGPADSNRFAAEARDAGHDLVIAWGGDGTVNGAGAALAGSRVPLAVIGAGSGNGLARDLGLPLVPAAALEIAATGATRAIDAGELNGSLFFNVAGIGLDACIADRMASPDARRGLLGYVLATFSEMPAYQPCEYSIAMSEDGGPPLRTRAIFIAIANSRQYGKGAQIAPLASLDDGIMDIVIVKPQSSLRIVSRLPSFFRGTLREDDGILMRTASRLEMTSDQPIRFHVDGEPRDRVEHLSLRTRPKNLLVRVKG